MVFNQGSTVAQKFWQFLPELNNMPYFWHLSSPLYVTKNESKSKVFWNKVTWIMILASGLTLKIKLLDFYFSFLVNRCLISQNFTPQQWQHRPHKDAMWNTMCEKGKTLILFCWLSNSSRVQDSRDIKKKIHLTEFFLWVLARYNSEEMRIIFRKH